MEKENQSRTIKLTIKMKGDNKTSNNSLTTSDQPEKVESEPTITELPKDSSASTQEQVDTTSPEEVENSESRNEDNPYQMVVYQPEVEDEKSRNETVATDPSGDQPRTVPRRRASSSHAPCIGSFTVQCCNCFKWRIIPTKEKYEEIREHLIEEPFYCEQGKEWKPEMSCDEPPDITQDGSRLWAIDRPNIPRAPPGWERLLRFRVEGSSKFADVYYVSPSGKKCRSMVEIQRYLDENPQYKEGVSLSKFSFQIPRPLQEDYVRKRSAPSDHALPESAEVTEARPISWISQDGVVEPQLNGLGSLSHDSKSAENAETQPTKKKAKKKNNEDLPPENQSTVEVE